MSPLERDNIILEAALEWGAEPAYDIRNGTLGMTLYIECSCKEESSYIRKLAPTEIQGLYVVVTYPTDVLTYADLEEESYADYYDPKLS